MEGLTRAALRCGAQPKGSEPCFWSHTRASANGIKHRARERPRDSRTLWGALTVSVLTSELPKGPDARDWHSVQRWRRSIASCCGPRSPVPTSAETLLS